MTLPQKPVPVALALSALNLLVPGAGFAVAGDWRRAAALFVVLNAIFAAGLAFNGVVIPPDTLNPRDPAFNIVGLLTFVVQMFHGGGCLLLVGLEGLPGAPLRDWLVRDAAAAYSDLGSFHLLVAGALNYFASAKLYDVLTRRGAVPTLKADLGSGEQA